MLILFTFESAETYRFLYIKDASFSRKILQSIQPKKYLKETNECGYDGHMLPILITYTVIHYTLTYWELIVSMIILIHIWLFLYKSRDSGVTWSRFKYLPLLATFAAKLIHFCTSWCSFSLHLPRIELQYSLLILDFWLRVFLTLFR